ncbi:MAG: hypothetical protein NC131_08380 [Roseburia sp.]|nr:hypothetical protein [Roseburia sp.]
MTGNLTQHSRHLYDLAKLSAVVAVNDSLRALSRKVRADRQQGRDCPSAQAGVGLNDLLRTILDIEAHREDYKTVTEPLLFEPLGRSQTAQAVRTIIEKNVFA